ncbi:YigZ family protein, partial [bacterium]|nr:YigZ family protein [bacterium]
MKLFYETIKNRVEFEIDKIKGSRFIAHLFPINSKEEAENYIMEIKRIYHDARHHCYAYILEDISQNNYFKYSDDGEPSGTAGEPIYNVIKHEVLTNILIVVIRYFGGVKLGPGGLVKAYTLATKAVLDIAERVKIEYTQKYSMKSEYSDIKTLKHIFQNFRVEILKEEYLENVNFTITVPFEENDGFLL